MGNKAGKRGNALDRSTVSTQSHIQNNFKKKPKESILEKNKKKLDHTVD
jgi:hypothetical protein